MEKAGKRGKIPQSDWPLIMGRYEAGETLSSIARTYDCSPPAISYIVSRSRGKPAAEVPPPVPAEPQLVKRPGNGTAAAAEPAVARPAAAPVAEPALHDAAASNGSAPRRTLHLSLGNGHADPPPAERAPAERAPVAAAIPWPAAASATTNGAQPHPAPAPRPVEDDHNGGDSRGWYADRPAAQAPRGGENGRDRNGAFIDRELRSRVDGDIAAFLAAFDAALAADTQESRFGLREATDRLLRAGARTRIELERLEARVPLPGAEGAAVRDPGAWRQR